MSEGEAGPGAGELNAQQPQWPAGWVVPRPREPGDNTEPAYAPAAPPGPTAAPTLPWQAAPAPAYPPGAYPPSQYAPAYPTSEPGAYPPGQPPAYPPNYAYVPTQAPPYGPSQPYPPGVGYPSTYQPYPPPPRRRWGRWVTLGLVALLLLCAVPAAIVVRRLALGEQAGGGGPTADRGAAGRVPSPGPNAPARDRLAWIRGEITASLEAQSAALLRGDEKGFLAPVDSKARKLSGELERRFGSLQELEVKQYAQRVLSGPTEVTGAGGRTEWRARVQVQHCFVTSDCRPDPVTFDTRWAETSRGPRLVGLAPSDDDTNGPRPWEVSDLQAAVGSRAVIATTSRYAGRLPKLLREAEQAAVNADKFVLGGDAPDRYRIFFAGPAEWKRWYGGELPSWSIGFATPISPDRIEVVINLEQISADFVDEVLRHELGHVATLNSGGGHGAGNFWLIEGIAEYIQETGRPVGGYDGRFLVRRYLREGRFNGRVNVPEPKGSTPAWQVGARYGVSYYAVRRIAERFGRDKLLKFFGEVVREGTSTDEAARNVFGVSWSNVNADCARYVRRQGG